MRLATLHFSGAFTCHVTRWISRTFPHSLEFTLYSRELQVRSYVSIFYATLIIYSLLS